MIFERITDLWREIEDGNYELRERWHDELLGNGGRLNNGRQQWKENDEKKKIKWRFDWERNYRKKNQIKIKKEGVILNYQKNKIFFSIDLIVCVTPYINMMQHSKLNLIHSIKEI